MSSTTDDYDDFGGEPERWDGGEDPDELDEVEKFNKACRYFAVTESGTLLIAPKDLVESLDDWLTSVLGYDALGDGVRGHVHGGNIYVYDEDYDPLGADEFKLFRPFLPSLAVLGANTSGWLFSGLKRGDPGKQWEPKIKVGPVHQMAANILRYPNS